jgi:hypothetical protein
VLRADAVTGADDVLLHIAAVDTRELQDVLRTLPRTGPRVTTLLRLEAVNHRPLSRYGPTTPDPKSLERAVRSPGVATIAGPAQASAGCSVEGQGSVLDDVLHDEGGSEFLHAGEGGEPGVVEVLEGG